MQRGETNLSNAVLVVEHEGGHVRRDDGSIEDEYQDQPVPDGFERRVVKDCEMMHVQ